ncbi:MAG: hypothetical protein JWN78_2348 [Bacteroidota bacterium]|nr:hypothetical protein [Bacteroidota bacterium]
MQILYKPFLKKFKVTIIRIAKMRSLYLLLSFTLFIQLANAEQWYHTFVPRGRHVNALKFLSPQSILFGGGNEFNDSIQDMWLSYNKGLEWGNVTAQPKPWVKSLAFIDTLTGFAVGYSGQIFKTQNATAFWTQIPAPVTRQFNKVIYVTPQILFIAGGSVPRTDTTQTILKSTDGGNNWTVVRDTAGYWLKGIYFSDVNNGVAVGDRGTILRTTDGGTHWNKIISPVNRNFNAVRFLNTSTGYIVGGEDNPDSLSTILRTTNGGVTWSILRDDSVGILTDITFSSANTGYITGNKGTVLKTTNAGLNWTKQILPDVAPYAYFNCVEFKNDNLGMIGGKFGDLYVYTNSLLASAFTLGSRFVDTTNFTLIGAVNTHGEIATYNFFFSLDSTFATYTFGTGYPPDIKSDSLVLAQINITDQILLSDTIYYFYIQTRTLAGLSNGEIKSFRTTAQHYTFQTGTANNITPSTANLNGIIEKLPSSTMISFEYGTTPFMGNQITAVPSIINDTSLHNITGILTNLTPNTTYYYRLKGTHNSEFYYGDILQFQTQNPLQVYPASNITTHGATLNGFIDKLGVPATISFDYGTTPAYGNTITPTPASVNDTFSHSLSAAVTNLQPGTTYFYRIRGMHNSDSFFSNSEVFNTLDAVQTTPATNIYDSIATLNGMINGIVPPATVSFEYGLTPAFGNTVSAIPNVINDTFSQPVFANIHNLQVNKIYYFRVKAIHNTETYYGDTLSFFTGSIFTTFETQQATKVSDSSFILNGLINGAQFPASVSFEYGTTPSFGNEITAIPSTISDSLQHTVTANLINLIPNTFYYFRLKGITSLSYVYGQILVFHTGLSYTYFNTSDATNITNTSAQLNAAARHLSGAVTLTFEYGTTPSLGNSITANPPSITDTGVYNITANLSGLLQDQVYYFRIKGVNGGSTIFGDVKQFYAGGSEIPNWDFQYWKKDTVNIPKSWSFISSDFSRVPGHSGNYAVKISALNIVLNGSIGDGIFGGVPLNVSGRPDSIVFFSNYSIQAGDSAFMLLILKKNGNPVTFQMQPITATSGGAFKRLSYKINYDTLLVPDSIIIGFVSSNIFDRKSPYFNNFLIIDDISFLPGNTTFTNSGFESWFSTIIESPLSWFTFPYVALDSANATGNHMVSKVYFNAPDDYAAEISNITWPGGLIIGGELANHNGILDNKEGGFPIRGKHVTFNGYYKFFPAQGDTMRININMLKGKTSVGNGDFFQTDSVPDYTPFSIPINYIGTTIPDSADIEISCYSNKNNVHAGTRIIVDKLSFDGFVSGVQITKTDLLQLDGMKVYPNPARDFLIIENLYDVNKVCSLSLFSITGQLLREIKLPAGQRTTQMEVGDLSPGFYVLTMKKGENNYSKKITIQK